MKNEFYFADDGNYGNAEGLLIVDGDKVDEHFGDSVIDFTTDNTRLDFARWFVANNHEAVVGERVSCSICADYAD